MTARAAPPEGASAAVAAIWARHRERILEQVSVVERAVLALMRGGLDEPLRAAARREAHKLAGSLGTFGFTAGSVHARRLELLFDGDGPPPPEQVPAASELIVRLGEELRGSPAGAPASHGWASQEGASPLVLVVEDDLALADQLAAEAARRGLRVELAASPAEGRVLAARERPDVVLLDLTFDGATADAYDLLSELAAGEARVPVLVLTVRDVFTDRVEVARRGGRGFVTKSLPPQQAIDQVSQLIERTRAAEPTILAVDDDPAILDTVRSLLEPKGMRVATIGDPLIFWQELERVRPDLLLLDVDMPGVSGPELCRVVRNEPRWASLPVVFLTSRRDAATVREVFAGGADDYLMKPVIGEELVVRIRNRLDRLQLHRALAERDGLTGVPNRQSSTEGIDRLLRLSKRYDQPLSVVAIDLDRFKQVNDEHGHAAGDAVLRRLGQVLLQKFRGEDVVGRWGGEEFVVGMYGMTREDAHERMLDALAALEREDFRGEDGEPFQVGFSAGVAQYPDDGDDVAALHRAADAALYRAKAAGRGRVLLAGEARPRPTARPDVVLVEDDVVLGELLLHTLETRGHAARWLRDGAAAVEAFSHAGVGLPAVVLLDVDLPAVDGVSVLRRLRAEGALARTRVIMLTARSAEDDVVEALELGAFDHVSKPFSVPVLMHKVARALESRS